MRFSPDQIDRLVTDALEGADGHTIYAFDRPEHSARYIVGGAGTVLRKSTRQLYYEPTRARERIRAWIDENRGAETLGFWVDGDNVWFDAGETYSSREGALNVARDRGELAIWDRFA